MATATKKATTKRTVKAADKPEAAATDVLKTAENMTDAAREQFETVMTSFSGNFDEMREQTEEIVGEVQLRVKKTQDHIADVNSTIVEAAREEVTEAVQFANDLAKAKTFADALEIQRDYWTNLFETRMERARDMTETSVEVAREAMTPMSTNFGSMFENTNVFQNMFPMTPKA